jgi:hypothetical protein
MCPPGLTDSALAALRAALDLAMEFKAPQFEAEFASLDRETSKLRGWLGGHGIAKPPQDASRAALRDFVRDRDLPTLRQATLASFGCTDPFDHLRHGLIADEELFPVFLDRLDDYRENPRALRLCYRGLLHAYFQYDVERGAPPSARANWDRLRTYLDGRASSIATPGFQPSWVGTLQGNTEVLGADPGAFYGLEIFHGRAVRFEVVRAELPVTESSWLVWRVIVGQIEAATASPDAEFRVAIPGLIGLLEKHPLAKNYGLARLLTRYRRCASPTLHERLRDFAVETWGNPWLALNEAKWSVVSPDARMMVGEWLKLALLQKFFGLLAEDGLNETRRLKFWETYHQSIHAMYFALGDTARRHPGPDFREVRKQMEGLQLTLTHSTSKNNAFIMCIGEHVIVEFGEKGNACYIFHKDQLPFDLEGEVAGNNTALKHFRHVERLPHTDSGMGRWEDKFRTALANVVRVRKPLVPPQAPKAVNAGSAANCGDVIYPPRTASPQSEPPGMREALRSYTAQPTPTMTMEELKAFCASNRLQLADYRSKGGNLWVYTKQPVGAVAERLMGWGFRFKSTIGWWRQ